MRTGSKKASGLAFLLAIPTILTGCASTRGAVDLVQTNAAISVIQPTQGNQCRGTVRFQKVSDGVQVTADLEGLTPGAKHAIHVHELGDCSSSDAMTAGSHYNPEDHPHGLPPAENRHAGDLGNLQADGSGRAHYELKVTNLSLAGGENPIIGRAVIVHANLDDGGQPVGNAGARLGCGVIGVAKP
jgi:Cu-Zn family superoxide dismutase